MVVNDLAESKYFDDVVTMLGLSDEVATKQKEKLNLIINTTASRLLLKLQGETEIPDELGFIVVEVVQVRYNRLGNEGMTSYGQEGESISFNKSDFDGYQDDIDQWLANNDKSKKALGKVQFLKPGGW